MKLNCAEKLLKSENKEEMKTFLKNIGSNHILQNQKLIFSLNSPFNSAAERSEATNRKLTFSRRWALRDSNPQPTACKAVALTIAPSALRKGRGRSTAELTAHVSKNYEFFFFMPKFRNMVLRGGGSFVVRSKTRIFFNALILEGACLKGSLSA